MNRAAPFLLALLLAGSLSACLEPNSDSAPDEPEYIWAEIDCPSYLTSQLQMSAVDAAVGFYTLGLSVVELDGLIYAVGGVHMTDPDSNAFSLQDGLEVFDPSTGNWDSLAAMTTPRAFVSAVAYGTSIYTFGGTDDPISGDSVTVEEYDTTTDTWTNCGGTCPDIPTSGVAGASALIGDAVYYITNGETLEYDLTSDTWTNCGSTCEAQSGLNSRPLVFPDADESLARIYVTGSETDGVQTMSGSLSPSEMYYFHYDGGTGSWATIISNLGDFTGNSGPERAVSWGDSGRAVIFNGGSDYGFGGDGGVIHLADGVEDGVWTEITPPKVDSFIYASGVVDVDSTLYLLGVNNDGPMCMAIDATRIDEW